ncbi:conjugal transfer protein TraG N-terminal domain-containing protein [Pseudoalteromonas spongiae]|uniref:conjugal transfer protein TraG N-terminal domain-containing protein n=1 Tax=Pseudoalteromonas spongiae TaxID=298657 RepID=UPI000C2D146E|nr:conjugal transfer protein TraG N-terminal domain-containing protein [Pseudoalteromonas spongiae]
MDFTFYSIGDAAFIYEILMGLRRMFDYGYSSLHVILGSVAAASILTIVMKSWINPKSNPIQSWFIGLFLFYLFCGPESKIDVTIESVRTGDVYTVDEVPGFVAVASLMSGVMYGLGTDYENSFGSVEGYRTGQFLDPMRALVALEGFGYAEAEAKRAGVSPTLYNIDASVKNYLMDCVVWDIETAGSSAEIQLDKIKNARVDEIWNEMEVGAGSRSTYIKLNNSGFQYLTCPQAYNKLDAFFANEFTDMVDNFFVSEGVRYNDVVTGTQDITAGMASISAYKVAEGRFLSNKFVQVMKEVGDGFGIRSELTLIESRSQRHYQMAADRGMWLELSVGFATFLEGFVLFLIPLIAIILLTGGESMKAAGMFLGVLLWVMLWPVTMTAVNLFTEMALKGHFANTSLGDGTAGSLSFGMFSNSMATIESYISVASALCGAVPMLTLYILHRGVHTMMGVSGKASPDTKIDSQKLSPDLVNGGAGNYKQGNESYQAHAMHSAIEGSNGVSKSVSTTPGQTHAGMLEAGNSFMSTASAGSSRQASESSASDVNARVADSSSRMWDTFKDYNSSQGFDQFKSADLSKAEQVTLARAAALVDSGKYTHTDALALAGQMGGELGISGGVKTPSAGGASAGLSGGVKAALNAQAKYGQNTELGKQFTDQQREDAANIVKAAETNGLKYNELEKSGFGESSRGSVQRQQELAESYRTALAFNAAATDQNTSQIAQKFAAKADGGEIQNSQTKAGQHTIPSIVDGLSDQQTYLALAQQPESAVSEFTGGKPITSLTPEERKEALSGYLQGQFGKERNLLSQGEFGGMHDANQLDNVALWNTVMKAAGNINMDQKPITEDMNGNKIPLSVPEIQYQQAKDEAGTIGNLFSSVGSALGATSVMQIGNQILSSAGFESGVEEMPKPKNGVGLPENFKSEVADKLETPIPEVSRNGSDVSSQHGQNKGVVEQQEQSNSAVIAQQSEPLKERTNNMASPAMENAFNSIDFFGRHATNMAGGLATFARDMFADSVGENVEDRMKGVNGLAREGYDILSSHTPESINRLLDAANNGEYLRFGNEKLNPTEVLDKASAVSAALMPEAREAYEQSLNSPEAQKYLSDPSNPYHRTNDALKNLDSRLDGDDEFKSKLDKLGVAAQYSSIAGLNEDERAELWSALNGENTWFSKMDYARHLSNMDEVARLQGLEGGYNEGQYGHTYGDLGYSILKGDFDGNSKQLASMAIQDLKSTGSTAGVDKEDVSDHNYQKKWNPMILDSDGIKDTINIANSFEKAGMPQEAEAIRNSLQNLFTDHQNLHGYASRFTDYRNEQISSEQANLSQGAQDVVQSVLYGNGDYQPQQLSHQEITDLNNFADNLESSGLLTDAGEIRQVLAR